MPAVIVFSPGGPGSKTERLKVDDEPDAVVEKLGAAKNGFASFSPSSNASATVWVNRDQVRMVRASQARKGATG
jgi:hypothetical protein